MRHILLCLFAALWASAATAFDGQLDAPFDARTLDPGEKRYLQAALAHSGHYRARLDGAWGQGSQAALARATSARFGRGAPTWSAVATIAKEFARVLKVEKWEVVGARQAGMSYLAPTALMQPIKGANFQGRRTADDDLRIRTFASARAQADTIHGQVRGRLQDRRNAYLVTRDGLLITAGALFDGTEVYGRSEAVGNRWGTALIEWRPTQASAAQLMIASLRAGTQELPEAPKGTLRRAMRALETGQTAESVTPAPKPAPKADAETDAVTALLGLLIGRALIDKQEPEPETEPERVDTAGIAFYVNNTDLVAPASLAETCADSGLRLADGTPLTRLPGGAAMEIALFTSPARSTSWIAVAPGVPLAQNAKLDAVSLAKGGWTTGDVAMAKAELLGELPRDGRTRRIVTSLPARKRTAGAPLLDDQGRLAAVVLGPVEVSNASAAQQQALRKVSRAVPSARLDDVLKRGNILFQSSGGNGAPDAAIRALFCN